MRLLTITAMLLSVCTLGCQSPTESIQAPRESPAIRGGSSYTTAILIAARTQEEGIREEYAYLKDHFPGSRPAEVDKTGGEEVVFGHHTDVHDGRYFSVHTLVLPDGKIRPVYFDITSYFGK